MSEYGIRVVAMLDRQFQDDVWVGSYDPEGHDGFGDHKLVKGAAHALRFPTFKDAFDAWRATPVCRPIRDDGRPNRPLTAYTVEVSQIPEEAA